MSQPIAPRLPYDDAASPHEMFGDCQAAGAELGLQVTAEQSADLVSPAPEAADADLTAVEVPDSAAELAGSLHLHLN